MAKTAVIVVVAYGRYFLPFTLSNKSKVLYIYTKPVTGNRKVARFATSSSCLFFLLLSKSAISMGKKIHSIFLFLSVSMLLLQRS
jgi:hypothetical protein